jgi:small GTP-binding protein
LDPNLRDYEQNKFAIADILRLASKNTPLNGSALQEQIRDIFARLAEDRFNLVVVGRFSRGKTSLMNAIMGTDRLPTGIVPLTSVITTVSYGTKEQVVLDHENSMLTTEVPLNALSKYITQQGNPGNIQRIKQAHVHLRSEILRRGFYFVDTPGLGSAIAENTRTTESFLPQADAFLVVTSYESALSEEEMRFLKYASSSPRRIFFVLNKQDTVPRTERNEAIDFVRGRLNTIFGNGAPSVFSVSAREGLEAKRNRDPVRLAASGIPALEDELVKFLLAEKRTQFLLATCDRVARLMQALPSSSALSGAAEQIRRLAERIGDGHNTTNGLNAFRTNTTTEFPSLAQLRTCEICERINEALWQFLCKFQNEIIINRDEQKRLAERGGLCSFHTWQYYSVASPYGICASYPAVLDRMALLFRNAAANGRETHTLPQQMHGILPSGKHCALCKIKDDAEAGAIAELALRLTTSRADALSTVSAVCLPHFIKLSCQITDSKVRFRLWEHQATLYEQLSEDMKRFALKHDGTRRFLETQEEETAAERAMFLIAGHRHVNGA